MPAERNYYFAYGSNMLPRRIEARLGPCENIGTACLERHDLRFHKRGRDGSGKCDAFHTGDPLDRLFGVVYAISNAQRRALDDFEGPGYTSCELSVNGHDGELAVYAYVAKSNHVENGLQPFTWYRSIVMAGARVHGLPLAYLEMLTTVRAMADPDGDREAQNLALLGLAPG